jgi:pilus assembly protein CpaF
MRGLLRELADRRPDLSELDPAARRLALRRHLDGMVPPDEIAATAAQLSEWIDGVGPLSHLMETDGVTDVLANGPNEIWVEKDGRLQLTDCSFQSSGQMLDLVERLMGGAGVRVDAQHPIGDARLADGSRLHVVLPPLSGDQPLISIRRFPPQPYNLTELVGRGFLGERDFDLLADAVRNRRSIAVGGGTGSGKTTLLNALLGCVSTEERVIVIEETPELRDTCGHWISLLTRPANLEGRGAVDQSALVHAALRMRPDRIVVGEVRGPEAAVALQAMATGHEGSMLTVHARSASEIADRLLDLALLSEGAPSEAALRRRIAAAIDVYVHVARSGGTRAVAEIVER